MSIKTPCTLMLNKENQNRYGTIKDRLETYHATELNHQQTLMLLFKIVTTFLNKEYSK